MEILNIKQPTYNVNGDISCLVTFEEIGEVPFLATENDVEAHGREAFQRIVSGEFGVIAPYVQTLEELKALKEKEIKSTFNASAPIEIDGITYNGGDSSASAISGAVTLAQALGEAEVHLWDFANVVREYTFAEAISISAQIGKAYRDKMLERQTLLTQVANATSKEEIEGIVV